MAFTKESKFEEALIKALYNKGWGRNYTWRICDGSRKIIGGSASRGALKGYHEALLHFRRQA